MTHQQQLHEERESERQRIESVLEGNVASIGAANGRAGLSARDKAGRIALVTLTVEALDRIIMESQEARAALLNAAHSDDEPAPDTKRSCPSSIPPERNES